MSASADRSAKNEVLHGLMIEKNVISHAQSRDVQHLNATPTESNKLLLGILKLRSVADVKNFNFCLCEVKPVNTSAIDILTKPGALAYIVTTILHTDCAEGPGDRERKDDQEVEKRFIVRCRSDVFRKITQCFSLASIVDIVLVNSLGWYIMCETLESLENVRDIYKNVSLSKILESSFNQLCDSNEMFQLKVH